MHLGRIRTRIVGEDWKWPGVFLGWMYFHDEHGGVIAVCAMQVRPRKFPIRR